MPRKLPWAAPAPSYTMIGEGSDRIVLRVSQDVYNGSVQYTVSVDGQQVGGVLTASAWKSSGQFDTVAISGDWNPGAHTFEVTFLNDAWGGSAGTDRNLYINSVTYDGTVVTSDPTALYVSGTAAFGVNDATPATLSAIGGQALHRTFGDEFDGFAGSPTGRTASGEATWQTTYFWGARTMATNKEAQHYSDATTAADPFAVRDGILHITAAPGASLPDGLAYTSGMITTHESFSQTYGYFEMRAQLPAGQGMWPAFWLLPGSGRLVRAQAQSGEFVRQGQEVATLIDCTRPLVTAEVSDRIFRSLRLGMSGAFSPVGGGEPYRGNVVEMHSPLTGGAGGGGQYRVVMHVNDPTNECQTGRAGRVSF